MIIAAFQFVTAQIVASARVNFVERPNLLVGTNGGLNEKQ